MIYPRLSRQTNKKDNYLIIVETNERKKRKSLNDLSDTKRKVYF